MAHFYSSIQGQRGEATRLGSASSGITTVAAGWAGAIKVHVHFDETTGLDMYEVRLTPWEGSGGQSYVIASGVLDANVNPLI